MHLGHLNNHIFHPYPQEHHHHHHHCCQYSNMQLCMGETIRVIRLQRFDQYISNCGTMSWN